jgi:hypothetical protein
MLIEKIKHKELENFDAPRRTIFRLLLLWFGAMIGKTADRHHPRPATRGGARWNLGLAAGA